MRTPRTSRCPGHRTCHLSCVAIASNRPRRPSAGATLPVILAIENDQQQITKLTAIVKGLKADLVLAESAEHALAAIGQRVPDLILTPALMSPKDDLALNTRLRELGDV